MKTSSVKRKLFMAISGLIIFYVLLSWFLNNQFLSDYYYYNKQKTLRESYETINDIYQGQPFDLLINLEKLERTEGLHIIIFDGSLITKYSSSLKDENFFPRQDKEPDYKMTEIYPDFSIIQQAQYATEENPVLVRSTDRRLNTELINLIGILNNGDYIYLSTPVVAIEESAGIANKFFLITGMFTILTGIILVFFYARRFTKPIQELNEIAQRMTKLDFSKKYNVKTYDEIGQLGDGLNSLSTQLEISISELREANEKLLRDIEKERKIDEMRKEFISNVSHELKTPIALIQGYAEGLKVNVNEKEEDKCFYCEVIIDESAKMNKLVKQLLELSQIDAGYIRLEKNDFDLTGLVEQVLKRNALLIRENGINLQTELEKDLFVSADIDRMEQILVNYLTNAINHSDEQKIVRVSSRKEEGKALVTVFNSGVHIPEQYIDKIWTSFYKIYKARTRSYGGTGLGLSIVRAIQELHANGYGVRNVDNGVEFWFEADLGNPV